MITEAGTLPPGATPAETPVLARGEATGHLHRIRDSGTAEIFDTQRGRYLRVIAETAHIVHEEHGPIVLRRGLYRFWAQREYTPPPAPGSGTAPLSSTFRTVRD